MKGLERKEIIELILAVRAGDNEALDLLIASYRPLILSVSKRYPSSNEYYCEALLGLYRAAMSFDINQQEVTFGLYASVVIRRALRDLFKSNERVRERIESDDPDKIPGGVDIVNLLVREEEREELRREMRELLSELECNVLMRWLDGLKTAEIAAVLSVTAKTVDNAKARILKKLRAGLTPR